MGAWMRRFMESSGGKERDSVLPAELTPAFAITVIRMDTTIFGLAASCPAKEAHSRQKE